MNIWIYGHRCEYCSLASIHISLPGFFVFFFLATLVLGCCVRALSSRSEQGLLSSCGAQASRCSGSFCCGAQALGLGTAVVVHGLTFREACGILGSWTRDQTCVSCIVKHTPNHRTTTEVPSLPFNVDSLARIR